MIHILHLSTMHRVHQSMAINIMNNCTVWRTVNAPANRKISNYQSSEMTVDHLASHTKQETKARSIRIRFMAAVRIRRDCSWNGTADPSKMVYRHSSLRRHQNETRLSNNPVGHPVHHGLAQTTGIREWEGATEVCGALSSQKRLLYWQKQMLTRFNSL